MPQDKVISTHPGPQTQCAAATSRFLLTGGARGGGKTFSLVYKAAYYTRKYHYEYKNQKISKKKAKILKNNGKQPQPIVDKVSIDYPNYRGCLMRRTYPDTEEIRRLCDQYYVDVLDAEWIARDKEYRFPSGAAIAIRSCLDIKRLIRKKGFNYHFIGIDEANEFPGEWIMRIAMNLRSGHKEISPQIMLTSNPGGVGHNWLKEKFVDRCEPISKEPVHSDRFDVTYTPQKPGPAYKDEDGLKWKYIPALVFDNPTLVENDPNYVRTLKKLPPTLQKMWLQGSWDCIKGMYFDNWDPALHQISHKKFNLKKFYDPQKHKLYRAYDWGTKAPFVCLFILLDENGNALVFDEIVQEGLSSSKQAEKVVEYTLEEYNLINEDFDDEICDPAYFAKTSEDKQGNLYSPADHYYDYGIMLTKGCNDRELGAKEVYDALEKPSEKTNGKYIPRIRFVTNRCEKTIKYLKVLPSDPKNPEDVDTDAWDHSYDALRYWTVEYITPKKTKEQSGPSGWRQKLKQAKQKATGNKYSWLAQG